MSDDEKKPYDVVDQVDVDVVKSTAEAFPVTPVIWQPFAQFHFYSARVLYEKVIEVEARYGGSQQSKEALKDEYLGYVTGTILTAVAFLEALINETFLRAVKRTKGEPDAVLLKLSPNVIASMAHAWKYNVNWSKEQLLLQFLKKNKKCPEAWYILNKYQLALYFVDKTPYQKPFVKNGNFWQDIELLQELRNALIHYKPESIAFPPTGDPYKAETTRITELLQGLNKLKVYAILSIIGFIKLFDLRTLAQSDGCVIGCVKVDPPTISQTYRVLHWQIIQDFLSYGDPSCKGWIAFVAIIEVPSSPENKRCIFKAPLAFGFFFEHSLN